MGKVKTWWLKVRMLWVSFQANVLLEAYSRLDAPGDEKHRESIMADMRRLYEKNKDVVDQYAALTGTSIFEGGNHHG